MIPFIMLSVVLGRLLCPQMVMLLYTRLSSKRSLDTAPACSLEVPQEPHEPMTAQTCARL